MWNSPGFPQAEYEARAQALRDERTSDIERENIMRADNKMAIETKVSHRVEFDAALEAPDDTKSTVRPQSVALWFQTPEKDPPMCTSSAVGSRLDTYSATRPVSVNGIREGLPKGCTLGQFKHKIGQDFKNMYDSAIPPAANLEDDPPTPHQCGAYCKVDYSSGAYALGVVLQLAFKNAMKKVGGYKKLLERDVLLLVEVEQSTTIVHRHFVLMPNGVGSPELTDLVVLTRVPGTDDDYGANGIQLTYLRKAYIDSKCPHPAGLKGDAAITCYTDDQYIEYILSTYPEIAVVTITQLKNRWPRIDICVTDGHELEYFQPMVIRPGGIDNFKSASAARKRTHGESVFNEDENNFDHEDTYHDDADLTTTTHGGLFSVSCNLIRWGRCKLLLGEYI